MLIIKAHVLVLALKLILGLQPFVYQRLLYIINSLNQAHDSFFHVNIRYS